MAIFGFSFKKDSGDTPETLVINICQFLRSEGAILHIYDPKVRPKQIKKDPQQSDQIITWLDPYKTYVGCESIILVTAWDFFRTLDYRQLYNVMEHPSYIFDGCHLLNVSVMKEIGFIVYSLGCQF